MLLCYSHRERGQRKPYIYTCARWARTSEFLTTSKGVFLVAVRVCINFVAWSLSRAVLTLLMSCGLEVGMSQPGVTFDLCHAWPDRRAHSVWNVCGSGVGLPVSLWWTMSCYAFLVFVLYIGIACGNRMGVLEQQDSAVVGVSWPFPSGLASCPLALLALADTSLQWTWLNRYVLRGHLCSSTQGSSVYTFKLVLI